MRSPTTHPASGDIARARNRKLRLGRFGRYLVPLDDPELLGFFLDNLYLTHNRSERLGRRLLSPSLPALTARLAAAETLSVGVDSDGIPRTGDEMPRNDGARRALATGLAAASGAAGDAALWPDDEAPATPLGWIFRDDYPGRVPRRGLLMVFGAGDSHPGAVVKLGRGGHRLEDEMRALQRCRRRLPEKLRATLPRPLGWCHRDEVEVLALGWRPGRSAYHDLYRDLSPARRTGRHFEAASRWLAEFHRATGPPPGAPVAGHGDFWPGNLLLDTGSSVTVVDWEDFTPEAASPFDDLFRFPFDYGLHYPWQGYRRATPEEAFARTFLLQTELSHHVRRYLESYCRRTGSTRTALREELAAWLARRARECDETPDTTVERRVPWERLQARLTGVDRSVFSG